MRMMIHVATKFSPAPFGRNASHDPDANGEKFREELLVPALHEARANGGIVVVDFSNTRLVGPSFIEEAFGGLIEAGFTSAELRRILEIRFPANREREKLAWDKIDIAEAEQRLVH